MPPEIRYAQSDGVFIAYQVFGSGPQDVVVAPGYMSHLQQNWEWPAWARWLERLASFSRVIMLDRRGTGLSDRVTEGTTLDDLMDDISAVMDDAGSERAAVIGGAEGGPMCILFAATHPDRTSALVVCGGYARRLWAPDYPWGISAEMDARIMKTYARQWGREPMGIQTLAPDLADDPAFRRWYLAAQLAGGSPGAAIAWYRVTADIDVRHVLPVIGVPTLVIHRTDDRALPVEHGRYLAEHIPGVRYVELPGNAHFWFDGDADAVIGEIQEFLTGARPAPELDRVLATVMFSDIVASTERAAQLGDRRWDDVIESHRTMVRAELARFRGVEVDTAGDGFLARFDGPARAIRCALAIVRGSNELGIEVRIGLHTGEVELARDGIRGIAVHIGARVGALAGAGEVLVSSTVRDLVAGSGIQFEDRGSHALKGVPGEWRLFAVLD
ncbi:MAG TPA: alpha/beta fold hydrolase [Candidatus Limnocylindria bacterium]|nr:alpha/beta fold hydrolase [Candidatus Limnocylindria bacterium]